MKYLIAICAIVCVVGVSGHSVPLSDVQKEKAAKIAGDCGKDTGIKPETIAEAKKGNLPEDETFKKFILCFFQKADIVDNDGKLNVATAIAKLPAGIDKADAEKLLESCKNKTGKDAADTAYEILKCYKQGTKTHISLGF